MVDESMYCRECGNPMFITSAGVSHHLADETSDEVDHDADADHVAIQDTSL
jgi:tRNA A37 threonylcarbamoyladenosine synthetase subunit TsaC/SUA5/YrdC